VGSDGLEVGRVIPGAAEVNSKGWTNWLWIKPVFGVCGELWLSFRLFGYLLRLFGWILWVRRRGNVAFVTTKT
jgi:hypothetical protein